MDAQSPDLRGSIALLDALGIITSMLVNIGVNFRGIPVQVVVHELIIVICNDIAFPISGDVVWQC